MLWDRVNERKYRGKAGFGRKADKARAPKMFMLAVQQINGAVIRAAHPAQLLNDPLAQSAKIGHCADFGGEMSDQVQEFCRGSRRRGGYLGRS